MNAFSGLLKKDMLISRFWYVVYLIAITVGIAVAFSLVYKWNEADLLVPLMGMMIPIQIFYIPLMVFSLLRVEGKTQLWLYNPQSSFKLLLSKITVSFIFHVCSQIFFMILVSTLLKLIFNMNVNDLAPVGGIALTGAGFVLIGLYLSILVIFLWTVYHSLGKFPAWRNYRWLAVAAIFFGYNTLETLIVKVQSVNDFVLKYQLNFYAPVQFSYQTGTGWEFVYEVIPIPIIPLIYYTLLALILFAGASRLLDKKVEV